MIRNHHHQLYFNHYAYLFGLASYVSQSDACTFHIITTNVLNKYMQCMQIYIDIEYSDSLITNEQFQFNGNTIFTKKIMLLNLFHSRTH